jgi:ABC-type multidrug transport system fused ATPase/permease subunit
MSKILRNIRSSALYRSAALITGSKKKRIYLLVFAQVLVSSLDLLGVLIIGAVGGLAVLSFESQAPSPRIRSLLSIIGLAKFSPQTQVLFLACTATIFLITRSILSIVITRKILKFLAYRGALLAGNLVQSLFSKPLLVLRERTEKESIFAITTGVEEITVKILGPMAVAVSDASLLIFLSVGLIIVQPIVALTATLFFVILILLLHKYVGLRSRKIGKLNADLSIISSEEISTAISTYRELFVRYQLPYSAWRIRKGRESLAEIQSEMAFLPNIGKYVMETGILIGGLLLCGFQFAISNGTHAVATLAIFLTASTRITPALLRIQQSFNQYKTSIGTAQRTLELAESLIPFNTAELPENSPLIVDHSGFNPEVRLTNVQFSYKGGRFALTNLNLTVRPGEFIGLAGTSGAGKTTLVDLMLGLINPDLGVITISDLPPVEAIRRWPGAIAYVPQDVEVINGSVRENMLLGYTSEYVSDSEIMLALKKADLAEFVLTQDSGLDTRVGEVGLKLSGGQKQRLAIARALLSRPLILVMDEVTSALDADTEQNITREINRLKGECSIIMIAHRLSSIRQADKVVYISGGDVQAIGTFNEVRERVPSFDRQARSMGL